MDLGLTIHDVSKALNVSTRTIRRRIREDVEATGDSLEGVIQVRGRKVAWVLRPLSRNPEYRFWLDADEPPDETGPTPSVIDNILERLVALEQDVAALKVRR